MEIIIAILNALMFIAGVVSILEGIKKENKEYFAVAISCFATVAIAIGLSCLWHI